MKKVHSFTLSELLVVLVISSIAVTISFLALNNVQKQIRNINLVFEKQQKI
ncbi:MAG: type II secretion system protein, partial [Flavobacteriaceae bacterium]|nr:type II secretion system protein [Flavobacteriaceae bacterium]